MLGVIIISEMNPEGGGSAQEFEEGSDPVLELAIEYALHRSYPSGLSKEKKRVVRKRAAVLVVSEGH